MNIKEFIYNKILGIPTRIQILEGALVKAIKEIRGFAEVMQAQEQFDEEVAQILSLTKDRLNEIRNKYTCSECGCMVVDEAVVWEQNEDNGAVRPLCKGCAIESMEKEATINKKSSKSKAKYSKKVAKTKASKKASKKLKK